MILISNDFWHKRKMYNFDPYNVFLAKYSCAAYDCACAPGTQILMFNKHIKPEQRFSEFHELMMESQKRKRM